jgi:hypothetical protein
MAVRCASARRKDQPPAAYCAALGSAIASFMAAFIFSIIGAMRDCMIDIDFCITKGIFSTNATPAGLS